MSAKRKYWIAGLVVAGIGVVMARVVSQQFDQPGVKLAIYGAGIVVAFAGVAIIMCAMKKKGVQ